MKTLAVLGGLLALLIVAFFASKLLGVGAPAGGWGEGETTGGGLPYGTMSAVQDAFSEGGRFYSDLS